MIRELEFMTAKVNSLIGPHMDEFQCMPIVTAVDEETVQLEITGLETYDYMQIGLPVDVATHLGTAILTGDVYKISRKYEALGDGMIIGDACGYYCSWTGNGWLEAVAYGVDEEQRIVLMLYRVTTTQQISFKPTMTTFTAYFPEEEFYELGRNLRIVADGIEMAEERKFLHL